jgi:carboxyl-terminal processing protease
MVPAAFADATNESLAARVRVICDTVQAHHVEAPTRQQMVHAGILAMYHAVEKAPPSGLGERVSGLTTHEQFAALLAEVRPKPGGAARTEAALDQAFLDGLSEAVPGGLVIMEAKESKVAEQLAGNRYVGIQISVTLDEASKLPKIMGVLEGGPAQRAGMKEGDVIETVDGQTLGGLTLTEYIDTLRGEEGTPVTVAVRRAGEREPRTFHMTRQAMRHATIHGPTGGEGFRRVTTEAVPGAAEPNSFRLAGAGPIGYLKIDSILASTPREVREAAAKMEAEGLKAVVIDLRGMRVGLGSEGIHSAVLLADELLDSGTIGRVRLASREITYRAEPGSLFSGLPIAVLVDRATSDYAEWIAAALKASKRATIVGTTTAGLGTSRSNVPVGEDGRTASLVTGLLEWPDGRPIGYFAPGNSSFPATGKVMAEPRTQATRFGVSPDITVSPMKSSGAKAEDRSLNAALEVLTKAIRRSEAQRGGGEMRVPSNDGRGSR